MSSFDNEDPYQISRMVTGSFQPHTRILSSIDDAVKKFYNTHRWLFVRGLWMIRELLTDDIYAHSCRMFIDASFTRLLRIK